MRSVCQAPTSNLRTVALPGFQKNVDGEASIDTMVPDTYQVVFHPCGHRVSPLSLPNYFRSELPRNVLFRNDRMVDHLGQYLLKCVDPNCKGRLVLPTCRLAGPEVYNLIKQWHLKEQLLSQGGVGCSQCGLVFLPPVGEVGPRRVCPSPREGGCGAVFCEQHHQLFSKCGGVIAKIAEAFRLGAIIPCPNAGCTHGGGQKDERCTHTTCVCGAYFCCVCRSNLVNRTCPKGCKLFLYEYDSLRPAGGLTGNELKMRCSLNFHWMRTVLLLQKLKDQRGFDRAFQSLSAEERSVRFSAESAGVVLTREVTLADVKSKIPLLPHFKF